MKSINFKEKQYKLPENWSEVTLKMVIESQKLSDLLPDAPLIAIISAYTTIPIEVLSTGKVQEVNDIVEICKFIEHEYVPVPRNEFEFQGVKYASLPDLAQQEFQDYLSIQTILYNHRENPVEGLSRMIAVYCKRPNESLDGLDLNARATLFLDLPFTIVKDVEAFFFVNLKSWKTIMLLSSKDQEVENLILERFNEVNDIMRAHARGLGTFSFTRWLITIYRKYLMYLKRQLEASFNSRPSVP